MRIFNNLLTMRGLNTKKLAIVILAILIMYGLLAGFMYSLNYDLGSDTVVPGIVAMEIFSHGNFQFDYPVNDPHIFTDVYTFHLLPQYLSGYDPTVLRLTAFVMFLILIAIFAYIIYGYAGTVSALMFAALMANLSPDAYWYFISPDWHLGMLIGAGLFIILLDFDRIKKRSLYWTALCVFAVGLVMLSDSSILTVFIIPYVAYYILFKRPELKRSSQNKKTGKQTQDAVAPNKDDGLQKLDLVVLSAVVIPGIAWLFKTYEPLSIGAQLLYFNSTPVGLVDFQHALVVNLPLYFQALALLVNTALFNVLSLNIGILDIPVAVMFLVALGISFVRVNKKAGYLYGIFLGSAVVMFLGFVLLSLTDGLWSARFLIFTALAVFGVIALAYDEKDEKNKLNILLLALVIVLVLATVPINYSKMISLDGQPNKEDYQLIAFIESRGYNYGYSDYTYANTLTYLSKEKLTVRSVQVHSGTIDPYAWLGSLKWYDQQPSKFFIVSKTGTQFNGELYVMLSKHAPTLSESYKGFNVYYFNYGS